MITQQIFIEGYSVEVDIGIHDFERETRQQILIDIEMDVEFEPSELKDEIGSVLDYDFLRQEISNLVEGRRFDLQETLCLEIVEMIAAKPTVLAAVVSTRKPDVYPDCQSVGVRLRYRRD